LDDLPALMALEEGAFGPRGWVEEFVRQLMEDPNIITLVVEDQGVIAYTMFSISPAYETAEVLSLAVSPARRRRGLGRGLMDLVERISADEGAQTMMLCVRPDNQEAVNLYLSRGYKVLARCGGYYEDGSDADMLVKHLED
jgi:ribosomal-protein-alanine N-acetyltransferase